MYLQKHYMLHLIFLLYVSWIFLQGLTGKEKSKIKLDGTIHICLGPSLSSIRQLKLHPSFFPIILIYTITEVCICGAFLSATSTHLKRKIYFIFISYIGLLKLISINRLILLNWHYCHINPILRSLISTLGILSETV